MPNNKRKSLKDIKKKDVAHPYSRRAQQMSRAIQRTEKMEQIKSRGLTPVQTYRCDKYLFFKYLIGEAKTSFQKDEILYFIRDYLLRNSNEEEKTAKNRSFKNDLLNVAASSESANFFVSGIEIPDLTSTKNVKNLRDWEGDWNGITKIKAVTVSPPSGVDSKIFLDPEASLESFL